MLTTYVVIYLYNLFHDIINEERGQPWGLMGHHTLPQITFYRSWLYLCVTQYPLNILTQTSSPFLLLSLLPPSFSLSFSVSSTSITILGKFSIQSDVLSCNLVSHFINFFSSSLETYTFNNLTSFCSHNFKPPYFNFPHLSDQSYNPLTSKFSLQHWNIPSTDLLMFFILHPFHVLLSTIS